MENISLCDDGTLDTVFECTLCGAELRYAEVERDECGAVLESEFQRVADEHADECEPESGCDTCGGSTRDGICESGCDDIGW